MPASLFVGPAPFYAHPSYRPYSLTKVNLLSTGVNSNCASGMSSWDYNEIGSSAFFAALAAWRETVLSLTLSTLAA